MAIDMIEDNELGALAPSRLGSYQFADEAFKNYAGGEDFFNLFGSRARKKDDAVTRARAKFANLPKDCQNIQKSIDVINNELQLLLKSKSNLDVKTQIAETNRILAEFKRAQIEQDCDKKLSESKVATEREETLKTLTTLSDVSVGKAQEEIKGLQGGENGDNTKKILIYGGVGLALVVAVILILRK